MSAASVCQDRHVGARTSIGAPANHIGGLRCESDYWFHRTGTGVTITAGSIFTAPSMKRAVAQALEERGRDELDRTLAQLAALATARER